MEQTSNLKLPLINVNNAEDLKKTFIDYIKMISGVDDSSALQILDKAIQNLQTTKQDKLTPGENITITNNVISGVGGVSEEDVMDIIENNAEQTDTLEVENATEIAIGTSETFDATSDEQIPTSKAVSDLMASAGGGSKLYEHNIRTHGDGSDREYVSIKIISTDNTPITSVSELASWLYNNGYTEMNKILSVSGVHYKTNSYRIIYGIYSEDGTNITSMYNSLNITSVTVEEVTYTVMKSTYAYMGDSHRFSCTQVYDYVREL